jgi:hypothetical protein
MSKRVGYAMVKDHKIIGSILASSEEDAFKRWGDKFDFDRAIPNADIVYRRVKL